MNTHSPALTNPSGPIAADSATLWWILIATAVVVFAIVMGILLVSLFRRRPSPELIEARPPARPGARGGLRVVVGGGIVIPAVVLIGVMILTVRTMIAESTPAQANELTLEVVAHQFWWEVRYPGQNVVTANEIHIPARQPVDVRVTSADVVHSLWVPELAGKTDVIPGQTNDMWLQANRPGEYRGQCAEFCGLQHAHMAFLVIADEPDQFQQWMTNQQQVPPPPTDAMQRRGQQVFLGSACAYCHTIEGTNASGKIGPDLTHLASRKTLAAGTLPNGPGALGGWILNPQNLKPGNLMPATDLDSNDLQALLEYLDTLK